MAAVAERKFEGMAAAGLERKVLEIIKASEERGDPPSAWASVVGRCVQERGLELPSLELGDAVVGSLCFANNTPSLWKFLDQAIASGLLSPFHTLALLTSRVIPQRQSQPEAYRLYLELLSRYGISFSASEYSSQREKISKAVINTLQLIHCYEVPDIDIGKSLAFFFWIVITKLFDCSLEDLGIELTYLKNGSGRNFPPVNENLNVDGKGNGKRHDFRRQLCKRNTLIAMEVAEKLTADKKTKILLHLLRHHMPGMFENLRQRFQFIEIEKSKLPKLSCINHSLAKLSENISKAIHEKSWLKKRQQTVSLDDLASPSVKFCPNSMASLPACWIPFDIFMENTMDGKHLYATSAIDILTDLTKTLQVVNHASWQETFQALWISALRLVQRERESVEGPVPHLDARLCILLSVTPLAIVGIVKQEEVKTDNKELSSVKCGLVSSIQLLRQFGGLLFPPPSVVTAANNAARKAVSFISNSMDLCDTSAEAVGNMMHLIVEACIARNLIDTSAYFWLGYVTMPSAVPSNPTPVQLSPWLKFMEGSPLTSSLTNALTTTPASTVDEVKKLHSLAINGLDNERAAAAKILCGASLCRGWNIQEHVLNSVVELLSSPVASDTSGYMSMINPLLFGLGRIDIVYIISVYGMVPDVAAALMPLCEVFGSLPASSSHRAGSGEEASIYSVFSCAFLFLLRLWKFYRPPQEHCVAGRWGTVRTEVTLDYLLLMYNGSRASEGSDAMDVDGAAIAPSQRLPPKPVFISSFPKLRAWYLQNQACIAATVSGFFAGNPIHQVANKILSMICRKMTSGGSSASNPSSSTGSSGEDAALRPSNLPAWELMESLPFVLEALLTACAHGRLSSRELITGLRDLVDFLPASLATIISYFSSEITRGVLKPVEMNGVDWPSPLANLVSIEEEIRDILASAGVHVPSRYAGGNTAIILPLPMAALISLTITFKLDPSLEYISGVAGPALENCAANCASPCMPIIGALWAQKVRRWHDFIIMSCARSPFEHDQAAIRQLLGSCFASFLGSNLASRGGVDGLLGHAVFPQGPAHHIPPGLLYLRSCRKFYDPYFVTVEILHLVIRSTRQIAGGPSCQRKEGDLSTLSSGRRHHSLAAAAAAAKEVATLGASLLCIAGGPLLVQVLYKETIPTWLLSSEREEKGFTCHVLEGQALAHMLFLSGSFVWGVGKTCTLWEPSAALRALAISCHAEFVAGEMEGSFSLGCHPATWKSYALSWLQLMADFGPDWLTAVKVETLQKLASGLRAWHEGDLALALLERGGRGATAFLLDSSVL